MPKDQNIRTENKLRFHVVQDESRETGSKRIWEMISRDHIAFWLAGMLNLLLMVPFAFGVGYACATPSLHFTLLAGVIGGDRGSRLLRPDGHLATQSAGRTGALVASL